MKIKDFKIGMKLKCMYSYKGIEKGEVVTVSKITKNSLGFEEKNGNFIVNDDNFEPLRLKNKDRYKNSEVYIVTGELSEHSIIDGVYRLYEDAEKRIKWLEHNLSGIDDIAFLKTKEICQKLDIEPNYRFVGSWSIEKRVLK